METREPRDGRTVLIAQLKQTLADIDAIGEAHEVQVFGLRPPVPPPIVPPTTWVPGRAPRAFWRDVPQRKRGKR